MGSKSPDYGPLSRQANRYNAIGSDFLNKYMTDTVSPAQQAELDLINQRGSTAVRTAYANSGISAGSTMEAQDINNVGLSTEAVKAGFLDQYLKAAGGFFQGASSDLTSILQSETQMDAQSNSLFSTLTGGVFDVLGQSGLFGSSSGAASGAASAAGAAGSTGTAADLAGTGAADLGGEYAGLAGSGAAASSGGFLSSIGSWIGDLFAFL